jgi:pentose-5-phosphate-3-epimerase
MLACPENAAARVSAGGINAGNATALAQAGADVLVAAALSTARPQDVQVRISPAAAA